MNKIINIDTDIVIVGSGIAGLYSALNIPEKYSITIVTKKALEDSNSALAQGGICVSKGEYDIKPYNEDTLKAGKYENDIDAVTALVNESKENVDKLIEYGVDFDKQHGELCYTKEAAHSTNRILHVKDETGRYIMESLCEKIKLRKNTFILENTLCSDIIENNNSCHGIIALNNNIQYNIHSQFVIMATGGIGGLFKNSTNRRHITGDGLSICKKHNIQFLYYCINCKSPLCSDCYMFENEHKTHSIKKISEIYQNHLQDVKKEKYYLEHKCLLLGQNLSDLNEKISEIGTFKYKKTKELNEMYKNLTEKLENNIETINKKLQAFREKISDRLVYLEASSKKINKEINESSQSELIKKSENIIFQIKKINEESNDDEKLYKQISLNLSTEVPNEIIPQYESSYFEVPDYKSMMEKDKNDIIFSPEMRINGLIWRIKLYPLGNNSARGEYISIFLELTDGLNDKSVYYYKIELINFQRKKNFAQEYSSEFANGESWGYSKFFKLDRLEKEGFIDSKGKIAVKIYIRPGSYEILVRDLRNYIGFLEEKVDSKNESKESSDEDEDNSNCYKSFSIKFDKLKIAEGFIIDDKEKKVNLK